MHSVNDATPPLRISVPGDYWDSHVYAGELYLFGRAGELRRVSWARIIDDLDIPAELQPAARAGLLGNHLLYEIGARQLLADPEIGRILKQRFLRLAALMVGFGADRVRTAVTQDNPFPFPHYDVEMHYSRLYVGCEDGLFGMSTEPGTRMKKVARQLSEAPAYDIAARFSTMAQACGDDGLIEVDIRTQVGKNQKGIVTKLSQLPCNHCEWAYSSVIASGHGSGAYVATFRRSEKKASAEGATASRTDSRTGRLFDRIVSGAELFADTPHQEVLTWGAQDKLYRYAAGRIEVIRYTPTGGRKKADHDEFITAGELRLPSEHKVGEPLSARVAPFGSVLELDEGLFVIPTAGEPFLIPGEPVNWRVFPRSVDYLNHLHIVYEDRLDVWVFTHDYFANQKEKLAGIDVTASAAA